ncbi:group-specific protein [Bacillus infantis]|uniref:group-specific protein n=1 Tax=Bacillus infantis TaxID=324767 RepID=UPI00209EA768|nr:group-specific protein [Bacillus infantis]MCP1156437.1 group-specific protein [Bacillus infantis]
MGTGFIVSMIVTVLIMIIIFSIAIPFQRKYIVKENGKINFRKSPVLLRWNVFDGLAIGVAAYSIICIQILNFMISGGSTIENPFVQFFTNQGQAWVIVGTAYLISRLAMVIKGVKELQRDD